MIVSSFDAAAQYIDAREKIGCERIASLEEQLRRIYRFGSILRSTPLFRIHLVIEELERLGMKQPDLREMASRLYDREHVEVDNPEALGRSYKWLQSTYLKHTAAQ